MQTNAKGQNITFCLDRGDLAVYYYLINQTESIHLFCYPKAWD